MKLMNSHINEKRSTLTYTLKEAAQVAHVSVPTMTAWANQPGFPALRAGRKWLIPCDLFKVWLEDQARLSAFGTGTKGR